MNLRALAPLGRALLDFHHGQRDAVLVVVYDTGDRDELSVRHFFRDAADWDVVEAAAVQLARGTVLDVGAGVGAHAVGLLRLGYEVTALEGLPEAAAILRDRGIAHVVEGDLWSVELAERFDSVLALMNGTGLAGTTARLPALIARLGAFVEDGGQILIDSAELTDLPGDGRSAGEIQLQLSYLGLRGEPFPHLFAGERALARAAASLGWRTEVVARGGEGSYLARLERSGGEANGSG